MLELSGYGATIGGRAIVSDVSMAVKPGQVLAILGPNGAGKSTFMKGLCGLRPALGTARLNGVDLLTLAPRGTSGLVGYVAQDALHLSVRLSVFELMLLAQNGGRHAWRAETDSSHRAEETLCLLKLERFAQSSPASLSGGERQMISLALALVRRPTLLLLDEPTSALDLANQLQMLDAVHAYTARHAITTLAILHDMNLATRYADQVLVLDRGRPHASGRTRDILTPDLLARVYGVDCRLVEVENGRFTAIYPVAVLPA